MLARFQLSKVTVGLFIILAMTRTAAHALDPNQPATSYLRTTFTVEDGLSSNVVNAILQTRDGFLWIATDAGLNRFDGRHFTPIYFRGPKSTPQGIVSSLAEGPDGDLWIGTNTGLVRISRPGLDQFDRPPSVFYHTGAGMSDEITFLRATSDGTLWVGTGAGLYRLVGNQFQKVIPNSFISRMEESVDGHLLFVANGQTFVELDGTRVIEHPKLLHELGIGPDLLLMQVFQDRNGSVWFATDAGLVRHVHGSVERFQLYGVGGHRGTFCGGDCVLQVHEDPQGNLWVLGQTGIFRIAGTKLEPLAPNIPSRIVSADREGNLWVGTNGEGLMRFKNRPVRMFSKADGLPNNIPMTVLSKRDGTLWVGNNCGGLSVFNGQHFKTYDERDGLSNSCVWALAEGKSGELWVGTWGGGLYRFAGGHFVSFAMRQGLAGKVVRAITVAHDGSLWIATEGGLSHMVKWQFHNYTTADGLSSNRVISVHQDRHGTIWVGTSRGINRMTGDRFAPVSSPHEMFDPRYISLAEDSSGQLYALSVPKGIDRIEGNQQVDVNHDLDLLSMVASPSGELWFTGTHGIFRFSSAAFRQNQADPERPPDYTWFGKADGMTSTQCSIGTPNMALAADGKLWVATVQGLAMLDLRHLPFDTAKPRVFVEDVTVGRTRQPAGRELLLPPGTHHVELRFDSISLASAEKIRFQYRMDDVDPVWLDADNSLTAVYTNIPIGTHAFKVRASNSDGVWNISGISFAVTQKPYFYQTITFKVLCVLALMAVLWSLYRRRVRSIEQRHLERNRAEEALRQARAELAHINRVSTMGELTASLAHEIKQPIGAAVTNAEVCLRLLDRERPDLPEAREAALEMARDARRAADVIEHVRSLFRKDSSSQERVDVNEVIREMVGILQREADRHSVRMSADLTDGLTKVMADRVQLQQALMNLMLNGIEAMRDATGELGIKSQCGEDGQVLISVSDTGVGLPTENTDQIFNAFFTTKSQGTGLGLAITRSIIESHGGRIWATANSGPGATFHFTLPLREAGDR
jgi:signal transduction histidine kinase/ligand-binding sensor domain-containing protein